MDADERLSPLKKAYADIILNTSKEAAARVIVSERTALRFQNELIVAKEEGIQMMLRLKKMMESKINEAEMTSRRQQGKIEELEAQLQEAEDIVRDLREELRYVQGKLERMTNNEAQYLDEHDTAATLEEASEENTHYTSQSIHPPLESQYDSLGASGLKTLDSNHRIEHPKCYNALIHMRNSYGVRPNLPSIILRSKEHESYRNGRTQRIHACERNLVNGELSLPRQPNDINHERKIEGDEEDKSIRPAPTDKIDNMCNIEKKEAVQEDCRLSSWYQVQANDSFLKRRDITSRCNKNRSPSCKQLSDKYTKMDQAPDTSLNSVKSSVQPEENPTDIASKLSTDIIDMGLHPECAETTEEYVKEFDVENKSTESETLIDIAPKGEEGESTKSFVIQVSKTNLEKVDEPVAHSESKASDTANEIPSQPVNPKVIKYTFQRKRKREPLSSSDGSVSLKHRTLKRKKEEKQNDSADPDKSCFVKESS